MRSNARGTLRTHSKPTKPKHKPKDVIIIDYLEQMKRANSLPAGFCAGFGADDAAAIALGISVSVLLKNNVKKETDAGRAEAHTLTGMGMLNIANNVGNRCCRRSVYNMGIPLTNYPDSRIKCTLKNDNPLCNGELCKFYQ